MAQRVVRAFLFLWFSSFLFGQGDPFRELEISRKRGDFAREEGLLEELEGTIREREKGYVRTFYERRLYHKEILLPEGVFYSTNVSALTLDSSDLWVGTRGGDLARYSLPEQTWRSYRRGEAALTIRTIQDIVVGERGLWILHYGGISYIDKRRDQEISLAIPLGEEFRGIQRGILLQGELLAGTQVAGVHRIGPQGRELLAPSRQVRNISYLGEDAGGLLVGTSLKGELYRLNGERGLQRVASGAALRNTRVLLPLEDGFLGGSYGYGLFQLLPRGEIYDYKEIPSASKWITAGVSLDGIYIFATLGEGLVILRKGEYDVKYYGIAEGLRGVNITALAYGSPYVVGAVQGRGLIRIHERFFREFQKE